MNKLLNILGLALLFFVFACERKSDYILPDEENNDEIITVKASGEGVGNVTWTKDKEYLLDGIVFVNQGQTLNIEAGTIIKAKEGQGNNASALVVARGGKIIAEGTEENPIIFTSEKDDLEGSLDIKDKGLWGGVIILGAAPINTESGVNRIEGIPVVETRADYGGAIEDDNSGVFKYVSIRHGGTNIGEDNEINGLTLGGVGNGTEIHHIEVIANADDGIEIFGGTIDLKNILVAYCDDDAFDFELGWYGRGQHWIAIQDESAGGSLTEMTLGRYIQGQKFPVIYNATFIGRGHTSGSSVLNFFNNAAAEFHNSIFMNQGYGVKIKASSATFESYDRYEDGFIKVENNIFYNIDGGNANNMFTAYSDDISDLTNYNTSLANYYANANNYIGDPKIETGDVISIQPDKNFSEDTFSSYTDSWFEAVEYKGAVGGNNWTAFWTLLAQEGILVD
jgi:hypothetical protein